MSKVLFVGDINVDVIMGGLQSLPVVDKEITCRSFDITVGSSAAIAACAYASLGGQAAFLGLAGNDDYGNYMLNTMSGEFGIDTHLVRRTSSVRTGVTVNLIHQNPQTGATSRTQITYPGTISEFEAADLAEGDLRPFSHIHLAGPYQQTRFRPQITRLLKLAASMGITTSLDPQWDATEKWQYMNEWMPLLSYLFVNEGEAISITGASSAAQAAERLAGKTRMALVKAGKDGSMVFAGGSLHTEPAFSVKVLDTTGAGDCFDSAFLYSTLEKKLPLAQAMKMGSACGSRSCTFSGGVAHRSTWQNVLDFIESDRRP